MSTFDNKEIEFICPTCKRKLKERLGSLKQADQKCPHCGTKFETSGVKRGIQEAEREIDRFKRELGKIKINIKL